MSANESQIGGDHYRAEFQHWDWIIATGLGYLEGNMTKYVARYLKKDGEQDLYKAQHYLNKMREAYQDGLYHNNSLLFEGPEFRRQCLEFTREFCDQVELNQTQRDFMFTVLGWNDITSIVTADILIGGMLENERARSAAQRPAGGPRPPAKGTPAGGPGRAATAAPQQRAQGQPGAAPAPSAATGSGYGSVTSLENVYCPGCGAMFSVTTPFDMEYRDPTGMKNPFGYDGDG